MLVCFASEKGGAGKTTLSSLLAERLTALGVPLSLSDGDPQASLIEISRKAAGRIPEATSAFPPQYEGLAAGDEVVFLDLPSGLRDEFYTAIAVADAIVVPAAPAVVDLRTLVRTLTAVRRAQELRERPPKVLVVPVKISKREKASRDLLKLIGELGWPTTKAYLADRSAYRRAGSGGLGALPRSSARAAINEVSALADEIIAKLEIAQEVRA